MIRLEVTGKTETVEGVQVGPIIHIRFFKDSERPWAERTAEAIVRQYGWVKEAALIFCDDKKTLKGGSLFATFTKDRFYYHPGDDGVGRKAKLECMYKKPLQLLLDLMAPEGEEEKEVSGLGEWLVIFATDKDISEPTIKETKKQRKESKN